MNDPSAPFDEFAHAGKSGQEAQRGLLSFWTRAGLRGISRVMLGVACATALFVLGLHTFRVLGGHPPEFLWTLKSAIPLMAIGVSYISLIFTVPRTAAQRLLGFLVGLAFVLWGVEQFMRDQYWISYIDDVVVFLFVLDLSIVIRGNLRSSSGGRRPTLPVPSAADDRS